MRHAPLALLLATLAWPAAPAGRAQDPADLADAYREEVEELDADHARRPRAATEEELAAKLPRKAARALERLVELEPRGDDGAAELAGALLVAGEAALALDRQADFRAVRARLLELDPARAAELGAALSRPRYQLRGLGGLDGAYLERFAVVLDAVLAAYDEAFGFEEYSKTPGKKLRVRVRRVDAITQPPFFDPSPPYVSVIDFPVVDADAFRSPTQDGKFLFYGLCHELGHVVAMWGRPGRDEDHHAWAHYTGSVVCERASQQGEGEAWRREVRDVRWRSLAKLRDDVAGVEPGVGSRDGVLALLVALHDAVGPRALGDAIDLLDRADQRPRVNRVRYYSFAGLREALLEADPGPAARERVEELLPR